MNIGLLLCVNEILISYALSNFCWLFATKWKICYIMATAITTVCLVPPNIASAEQTQERISARYCDTRININGKIVTPKDAIGKTVEPFIYNLLLKRKKKNSNPEDTK